MSATNYRHWREREERKSGDIDVRRTTDDFFWQREAAEVLFVGTSLACNYPLRQKGEEMAAKDRMMIFAYQQTKQKGVFVNMHTSPLLAISHFSRKKERSDKTFGNFYNKIYTKNKVHYLTTSRTSS